MKLVLSDESVSLVLDALEKTHRELSKKAESWSFDLEGDYEKYVKARQDELDMAKVVHTMKQQRTAQINDGSEAPLAEWERDLLMDKSPE